jgi:ubiquinone/menaquinone biosynthesis C-methylase UbiE
MDRVMQFRQARVEAAFLLPLLSPGMSLVDVGCGQGTITLGLARSLAEGRVVGFDTQPEHIERARALAAEQGVAHVSFHVADLFQGPVEPESFDVAYANAVVSHQSEPDAAIRAMQRMIKPGGLIALRDRGGEAVLTGDQRNIVRRAQEIIFATIDATAKNPYGAQTMGPIMNRLCRLEGFEVLRVTASWDVISTSMMRATGGKHPLSGPLGARAVQLGITTPEELSQLISVAEGEWLEDPDALLAVPWFEVVARKP